MNSYLQNLGHVGKDVVTGFQGVITSFSVDLFGCMQYAIAPPWNRTRPDDLPAGRWFDTSRVVLLSSEPVMRPVPPHDEPKGPAEKAPPR